ncbi:MAG: hypothetical protein ACKESC_00075 [Candidatus Hodgkinia cicadicola]
MKANYVVHYIWVLLEIQRLAAVVEMATKQTTSIVDRSLSVSNKLNLILRIIRLTASIGSNH